MRPIRASLIAAITLLGCLALLLAACGTTLLSAGPTAVATVTATPFSRPLPLPIPADSPPPPTLPPAPSTTPTVTVTQPVPTGTVGGGGVAVTSSPTTTTIVPVATVTQIPQPAGCAGTIDTTRPTYTSAQVRQAITDAANQSNLPIPLVEAFASEESGWQPSIIACTGDAGILQISKPTEIWINQFFGLNDDPLDLKQGLEMGTKLIAHFYGYYINFLQKNYPATCGTAGCDWDTVWPDAADHATVRDIVISLYNEGATTMFHYGILNWWYVHNVLNGYHNSYGGVGN